MSTQKYTAGHQFILLEEGTRLPITSATIIGFVPENIKPYRISYKLPHDEVIWYDDVSEDRLTTLSEIGIQASKNQRH